MSLLIVVCGLAAEAKIAAGFGNTVIAGGGDIRGLEAALADAAPGALGLLSFGVAGGLATDLRSGDLRVASSVVTPGGHPLASDPAWTTALAGKLGVASAPFAGVDAPLADVAGKAALHRDTGAAIVDMETHLVARAAARHGVRWAAIRVITDPAARALPHAAIVGMRADGRVDLPAILASLAKNPGQLPGLIRTGLDARAAFAALLRCRQMLGPGFALLDL